MTAPACPPRLQLGLRVVEGPVRFVRRHPRPRAEVVVTFATDPRPHQVGQFRVEPLQLLEALGQRVVQLHLGHRLVRRLVAVIDHVPLFGDRLRLPSPLEVRDRVAGDGV